MKTPKEQRRAAIKHDLTKNKVVLQYESTIEIDPVEVKTRIRQLEAQIAHMEYHHQKLALDIESAKNELQQLQQLNIIKG